eukprot:2243906-Pleurochrysis_carterae.AAC.7
MNDENNSYSWAERVHKSERTFTKSWVVFTQHFATPSSPSILFHGQFPVCSRSRVNGANHSRALVFARSHSSSPFPAKPSAYSTAHPACFCPARLASVHAWRGPASNLLQQLQFRALALAGLVDHVLRDLLLELTKSASAKVIRDKLSRSPCMATVIVMLEVATATVVTDSQLDTSGDVGGNCDTGRGHTEGKIATATAAAAATAAGAAAAGACGGSSAAAVMAAVAATTRLSR